MFIYAGGSYVQVHVAGTRDLKQSKRTMGMSVKTRSEGPGEPPCIASTCTIVPVRKLLGAVGSVAAQ